MAVPYSANYEFGDVLTAAAANVFDRVADNISDNIGLFRYLNKRGKVKPFDGGFELRHPINYAENGTYQHYSGAETLNLSQEDVLSYAVYGIKQVALTVQINGLEELQTMGENQLLELLEERIQAAMRTYRNNFSVDMYSAGTASGGKQVGGVQLLVADDPSNGVAGGIDRATWTFWQNFAFSALTDGGAAVTSANIQGYLKECYMNTYRNGDGVNLWVADNNNWGAYHDSLMQVQRINRNEGGFSAGTGATELDYMGQPMVLDGGIGGACPEDHTYGLNTDFLMLRPHSRRNMVPVGGKRQSVNQDSSVTILAWAGNMTMGYAAGQAVLTA